MNILRRFVWVGVAAVGLVFLAMGILYVAKGLDAKNQIRAGLIEEQIKTGKDGVQFGVAEGTLVTDAKTAMAQADTIKLHSISIKGEVLKAGVPAKLHYAEMKPDLFVSPAAYTNARNTYLNGVTLRTALNLAVMGFGLADIAIATGLAMILVGATTIAVGVPVTMYAVKQAEQEGLEGARRGIPAQATS